MADVMSVLSVILPHLADTGDYDDELYDESNDEVQNILLHFAHALVRDDRVCIKNYVESVAINYRPCDFKSHFRLEQSTFERVLSVTECKLSLPGPGRPAVSAEKQLLSTLWLLSNLETFRSVTDRFDLPKSSLLRSLRRVSQVLCDMAPDIIYWPSAAEAERNFKAICGFPGVIGAVDGTHIGIKASHVSPEKYLNRKKFYSVILQAVATSDLCFTHVTCSFPGSVHDARVFSNSEVNQIMCNNYTYFPEHTHIIGDVAYPLKVNLLTPYKNNGHLGRRQLIYNKKLSKTRVCMEQSFGQLKGRFRRLMHFDVHNIEFLPLYVLATCVLHNICIREYDIVDDTSDDDDDDDPSVLYTDIEDIIAENKRDYICGIV